MAEDEETATARYIASNVSTQLMLKTMFEIFDDHNLSFVYCIPACVRRRNAIISKARLTTLQISGSQSPQRV